MEDILTSYFSEISSQDVLGVDAERAAAEAVVEGEVTLWMALLNNDDAARSVSEMAVRESADSGFSCSVFETKPEQDAADSFGRAVRLVDNDRVLMRRAVEIALSTGTDEYRAAVRAADRKQRRAKETFITANLKLVVSVARRYKVPDVDIMDLIQDGNIGLIKGVERFDPSLGYRFSTYAMWWIRHAIGRSLIESGRAVRVPVHLIEIRNQIDRETRSVLAKTGAPPTVAQLCAATGLPRERVERALSIQGKAQSLDQFAHEDSGATLLDGLAHSGPSPEEELMAAMKAVWLRGLVDSLTPTEAHVIRWRFDLLPDKVDTNLPADEIISKYVVTRARLRQLQEQAFLKLRTHIQSTAADY